MFDKLTALSISIASLAGVATFLYAGPLNGFFFIWAATIPWAAYFFLGATPEALKNTIICSIFGVAMAWITALILTSISPATLLGVPAMTGLTVAVAVLVMCLAADIPCLATIPASVLGYSSTFAFLLQTPDVLNKDALLSFSFSNPLVIISLSIVIGTYLGQYSAQLADKLTKK